MNGLHQQPDPQGTPARTPAPATATGTGTGTGLSPMDSAIIGALNINTPPIDPKDRTKSDSAIDTIVGRIVVEQGLASSEDVHKCLEQTREGNKGNLAQILVEQEFITRRQLERLRAAAEAEKSGQQIPGFKILGKLGAGAMATVYKAKQLSLDRLVAIKVLPKKFTSSAQFIERFYAEGRAAAQLNHPNIVQAYDVGKAGEYHYFVMEYVDGRTVYDDIVKNKRYAESEAVEVAIQIADALQHAHERGLIHRDVKPKNLMINRQNVAKLADMGLARAISDKEAAEAEAGKAFGTPYYISPEQIRGDMQIGPPADIYSLGATLYHMVTGVVPFDGKDPKDVMTKHLKGELRAPDHVNPKLSAGISEVIEFMMAKDPRKRYQGCKDLLVDLRALRERKSPPIAHQDIAGMDMKALAQAEATAAVQSIPEDQSRPKPSGVSVLLFGGLCALLLISIIVNIVMALH